MYYFKDLFLQILIILLPVFFYHMFLARRYNGQKTTEKSIVIFFMIAVTMLLCMYFPIFSEEGLRYDLRYVVLMFGVFYGGGYAAGIMLFIVLLLYRYYLGGFGLYYTFFEGLIILPFICFFYNRFLRSNRRERTQIVIGNALFTSLIFMADHLYFINNHVSFAHLLISFVIVLTSWIAIFMIENIKENHRLHVEVQNMEKLRVLGELTSSFAHEIRNPMQVNRGYLQLLNESSIPDKYKSYIEICMDEIDRANDIITDYLTFAKPQADDMRPIEINDEISKITALLHSYALMQNVEIQVVSNRKPLWILGNAQKLKQCLINIIKNGIEAMPDGGRLEISCFSNESEVHIHIKDQGVGMSDQEMKRLGTPFYTLKDKGTGLGLMVSYRIVESFHGKIGVTSEEGRGTTFSISLPEHLYHRSKKVFQMGERPVIVRD
ncbi:ATP-binding protein [Ammoniphilus sp. 3BR4]|uniref:ATP-binding protein n=1 Tax=Ammoniphilus sp. 3BR4 TaxID=3158265 RepID=UPI0034653E24